MTRVRNDSRDAITGRMVPAFDKRPDDFEQTFVDRGRVGCEEHYGVGRQIVDRWLNECGKDRLVRERAEHCVRLGNVGCTAVALLGRERVDQLRAERDPVKRINRREIGSILGEAFRPRISDRRRVSIIVARHAAQHLRIRRNGGFIVSQAPNGDWRVGTKLVSPAQLVDMAVRHGFNPSLTGGE